MRPRATRDCAAMAPEPSALFAPGWAGRRASRKSGFEGRRRGWRRELSGTTGWREWSTPARRTPGREADSRAGRAWREDGIAVVAAGDEHLRTEAIGKHPRASATPRWRTVPSSSSGVPKSMGGESRSWLRRWAGRSTGAPSPSTAPATTGLALAAARPWPRTTARFPRRAAARPRPGRRASMSARAGGRSVVVAQEPSTLLGRVRFPSPALHSSGSGAVW